MISTLALPWPPSVNHYYRHVGPRVLISKDGRRYREAVAAVARRSGTPMFTGPGAGGSALHPPDNRRRDADNSLKSCLDAVIAELLLQMGDPDDRFSRHSPAPPFPP